MSFIGTKRYWTAWPDKMVAYTAVRVLGKGVLEWDNRGREERDDDEVFGRCAWYDELLESRPADGKQVVVVQWGRSSIPQLPHVLTLSALVEEGTPQFGPLEHLHYPGSPTDRVLMVHVRI
jgi:hypothetical protein